MGNPKQKWTSEEEDALIAGVDKHGPGKWKNIQKDPEFNHLLFSRSNIDLKDKWRNMIVATGQSSREKPKTIKPKANPDAPATPLLITYTASTSTTPVANDNPTNAVVEEYPKCVLDGKTASKYNIMIYEALSTMKDPNGSDISSVVNFIEQRHELPPNFRRLLTGRLRRLVGQGKLEKALNGYKIAEDILPMASPPAPKRKDIVPHQMPPLQTSTNYICETLEDAAVAAAYRVAEAENKSYVAAEAMKEAERVAEMAEDVDSFLQLAQEIFERCSSGEIVMMA